LSCSITVDVVTITVDLVLVAVDPVPVALNHIVGNIVGLVPLELITSIPKLVLVAVKAVLIAVLLIAIVFAKTVVVTIVGVTIAFVLNALSVGISRERSRNGKGTKAEESENLGELHCFE